VPTTSLSRKAAAQVLQESWRSIGAAVTVTAVDFPVFQQRLGKGDFDSYVAAYLDEPSPRSLGDQWSRSGWEALNFGRYTNPKFDRLLQQVIDATTPEIAHRTWREAMDTLNADAPALFLYAPTNVAAIAHRLQGVTLDPYSWLSGLRDWRLDQERSRALDATQ
jgi:ABC-type transport system substrate-binding protein